MPPSPASIYASRPSRTATDALPHQYSHSLHEVEAARRHPTWSTTPFRGPGRHRQRAHVRVRRPDQQRQRPDPRSSTSRLRSARRASNHSPQQSANHHGQLGTHRSSGPPSGRIPHRGSRLHHADRASGGRITVDRACPERWIQIAQARRVSRHDGEVRGVQAVAGGQSPGPYPRTAARNPARQVRGLPARGWNRNLGVVRPLLPYESRGAGSYRKHDDHCQRRTSAHRGQHLSVQTRG